jgi:zinc-ribbon domain
MNIRAFLNGVPRPFQRVAWVLAACIIAGGVAVVVLNAIHYAAPSSFAPLFAIPVLAFLAPTWVLCLGWVNADARKRAMPPWLWTAVAMFVPNLLGFLIYFACRRPLALSCPHCGQSNGPGQRFCSWCGHPAAGPLAGEGAPA